MYSSKVSRSYKTRKDGEIIPDWRRPKKANATCHRGMDSGAEKGDGGKKTNKLGKLNYVYTSADV